MKSVKWIKTKIINLNKMDKNKLQIKINSNNKNYKQNVIMLNKIK